MKYIDIINSNKDLGDKLKIDDYNIALLSNTVVHQLKDILEYSLRVDGISAKIKLGDYDNIVQDSHVYQDIPIVLIFWELSNIVDGLHHTLELKNKEEYSQLLEKIKAEINLVLKNLDSNSLVLFNKFSSLSFTHMSLNSSKLDQLGSELNNFLSSLSQDNLKLVNVDKVISTIGVRKSIDYRHYYSSKILYTIDFLKEYSEFIKPYVLAATGRSKKALIFDCDNTIWKGILGEDGFEHIQMSPATKDGQIFAEIQSIAIEAYSRGIILGLCSKNNLSDVDEVLDSHPDIQIRDNNIVIKKINWNDKASNLREMAKELNIGLDSFVFVDDSPFEINLVKEQLPEVSVLQVPEKLHQYPIILREKLNLFYNLSSTLEDKKKSEMYKSQIQREQLQKEFTDIEDYLSSLQIKMELYCDEKRLISRMSQMTQKTNQFNLTTMRYTESDINKFIRNSQSKVYAFSISDKFGESGVTGLSIVNLDLNDKSAEFDTFLMSCRVIGRNIEYAFMNFIIENLKSEKVKIVKATYRKTKKNSQVSGFYKKCGFVQQSKSVDQTNYILSIDDYKPSSINYIVMNKK